MISVRQTQTEPGLKCVNHRTKDECIVLVLHGLRFPAIKNHHQPHRWKIINAANKAGTD